MEDHLWLLQKPYKRQIALYSWESFQNLVRQVFFISLAALSRRSAIVVEQRGVWARR